MPFIDQVTRDIADAMKQKDPTSLSPLRMLKAALMNREVAKGQALTDAEALQVVNSLVKQRRDSIEQFEAGGRQDLADKEKGEIGLSAALPSARRRRGGHRQRHRIGGGRDRGRRTEGHGQGHEGGHGQTGRSFSGRAGAQRGRKETIGWMKRSKLFSRASV